MTKRRGRPRKKAAEQAHPPDLAEKRRSRAKERYNTNPDHYAAIMYHLIAASLRDDLTLLLHALTSEPCLDEENAEAKAAIRLRYRKDPARYALMIFQVASGEVVGEEARIEVKESSDNKLVATISERSKPPEDARPIPPTNVPVDVIARLLDDATVAAIRAPAVIHGAYRYLERMAAGEVDQARQVLVQAAIAETVEEGIGLTTRIIEAIVEPTKAFVPRTLGNFPRFAKARNVHEGMPPMPGHPDASGEFGNLPDLGRDQKSMPSPILSLYGNEGAVQTGGKGAPLRLRLFTTSLIALPIPFRNDYYQEVHLSLDDIVRLIWPLGGWGGRARNLRQLIEAAESLYETSRVVFPDKSWRHLVAFMGGPGNFRSKEPFRFLVSVPAQAANGFDVNVPQLMGFGEVDALAFRACLSAIALMDASSHMGHGITRTIGKPVENGKPAHRPGGRVLRDAKVQIPNKASRFVPKLTGESLARMAGFQDIGRKQIARAIKAFERLHEDGVIDLVQEQDGRFRVFAPNPALAAPKGTATVEDPS